MANIYWKSTIDADWAEPGNWYNDAACTEPASAVPIEGDFVYITGTTVPTTGPDSAGLSLIGFSIALLTSASVLPQAVTDNITISAGGSLIFKRDTTEKIDTWYGDASAATTNIVGSLADTFGPLGDNLVASNCRLRTGTTVGDNANITGLGSWAVSTVGDDCTINITGDALTLQATVFGDNCTLNGPSGAHFLGFSNWTFKGTATFNGNIWFAGTWGEDSADTTIYWNCGSLSYMGFKYITDYYVTIKNCTIIATTNITFDVVDSKCRIVIDDNSSIRFVRPNIGIILKDSTSGYTVPTQAYGTISRNWDKNY